MINEKSKIDLLTLFNKIQTQFRALESLGLTQNKYAHILFPLVESALHTDLTKNWERQKSMIPDNTGKSN